jgi:hypothetical protein
VCVCVWIIQDHSYSVSPSCSPTLQMQPLPYYFLPYFPHASRKMGLKLLPVNQIHFLGCDTIHFRGIYCFCLQGWRVSQASSEKRDSPYQEFPLEQSDLTDWWTCTAEKMFHTSCLAYSLNLKMAAVNFCEMWMNLYKVLGVT